MGASGKEPYKELEEIWAEWNGLNPRGMVACSSGTAALHLALESLAYVLNIPRDGLVALPDFTMVACARAVTLAGMKPLFIDCNDRLLMDPDRFSKAYVQHNLQAVMAVHIYGRLCDVERIHNLCKRPVIEDLAEAHGVQPHPNTDAACWSFYRNKIVHGEEGGAVFFRDPNTAEVARKLRCLGFTEEHDFSHIPRGHNYRMSNVHAGLIIESVHQARRNLHRRRVVESYYDEFIPAEWKMPPRDVPWVYDFRVKELGYTKQQILSEELAHSGLRCGFKPMQSQAEYETSLLSYINMEAHVASREIMYFPIDPELSQKQVELRITSLKEKISSLLP